MPRAMQSTAIPKRGNPGLLCPRNSAIPLHSHSEHLAETRGAFSPQVLNTALERQSYKELEIPIARSQYLFLYTGADSTSFFPPFVSFLWPDPTLQSRAEQGRAGQGWPQEGLALGSAVPGPQWLPRCRVAALCQPCVPCAGHCVMGTRCCSCAAGCAGTQTCSWLPSAHTGPSAVPCPEFPWLWSTGARILQAAPGTHVSPAASVLTFCFLTVTRPFPRQPVHRALLFTPTAERSLEMLFQVFSCSGLGLNFLSSQGAFPLYGHRHWAGWDE